MYCGQMVEVGTQEQILESPTTPIRMPCSSPSRTSTSWCATVPARDTAGVIPPLQHLPIGCRLGPCCPYAQKKCVQTPLMSKVKGISSAATSR